MDIDMSALRMLEREREIPIEVLIPTIEQALLIAYQKSPGAMPKARAVAARSPGCGLVSSDAGTPGIWSMTWPKISARRTGTGVSAPCWRFQ